MSDYFSIGGNGPPPAAQAHIDDPENTDPMEAAWREYEKVRRPERPDRARHAFEAGWNAGQLDAVNQMTTMADNSHSPISPSG